MNRLVTVALGALMILVAYSVQQETTDAKQEYIAQVYQASYQTPEVPSDVGCAAPASAAPVGCAAPEYSRRASCSEATMAPPSSGCSQPAQYSSNAVGCNAPAQYSGPVSSCSSGPMVVDDQGPMVYYASHSGGVFNGDGLFGGRARRAERRAARHSAGHASLSGWNSYGLRGGGRMFNFGGCSTGACY